LLNGWDFAASPGKGGGGGDGGGGGGWNHAVASGYARVYARLNEAAQSAIVQKVSNLTHTTRAATEQFNSLFAPNNVRGEQLRGAGQLLL
jgi:hypothetical protein